MNKRDKKDKKYLIFLSFALFLFGMIFLLSNTKIGVTGAVVGMSGISSDFISDFGMFFILIAIILLIMGKSLEEKFETEHSWNKYKFNKPFMMAEDVKKGYLKRKKQEQNLSPLQERIEKMVSGGKIIKKGYQEHTYAEHHERESLGGRIIDVYSHIIRQGKYSGRLTEKIKRLLYKGKLEHFNKPADGWYVWIIDEDENFVAGDRTTSESTRYGHKLPHPVLASEKRVYGAGEVLIKNGLIKECNSGTGHYFDRRDPKGFDKQSKEVFKYFSKKAGWKEVRGGAKYDKKHDDKMDLKNY